MPKVAERDSPLTLILLDEVLLLRRRHPSQLLRHVKIFLAIGSKDSRRTYRISALPIPNRFSGREILQFGVHPEKPRPNRPWRVEAKQQLDNRMGRKQPFLHLGITNFRDLSTRLPADRLGIPDVHDKGDDPARQHVLEHAGDGLQRRGDRLPVGPILLYHPVFFF